MTIVHVWYTGGGGVGHASMEIENTAYVSYWPGGGGGADAKKDFKLKQTHDGRWISSFGVDRRLEKKDPDATIRIDNLNEGAMNAAFEDLKRSAPLYNMRKHNCSTVVAYLLQVGSAKQSTFVPSMNIAEVLPPGMLKTIVTITTFGGNVKMWSPYALAQYARELAQPRNGTS